jgi:hypothetical protein
MEVTPSTPVRFLRAEQLKKKKKKGVKDCFFPKK